MIVQIFHRQIKIDFFQFVLMHTFILYKGTLKQYIVIQSPPLPQLSSLSSLIAPSYT